MRALLTVRDLPKGTAWQPCTRNPLGALACKCTCLPRAAVVCACHTIASSDVHLSGLRHCIVKLLGPSLLLAMVWRACSSSELDGLRCCHGSGGGRATRKVTLVAPLVTGVVAAGLLLLCACMQLRYSPLYHPDLARLQVRELRQQAGRLANASGVAEADRHVCAPAVDATGLLKRHMCDALWCSICNAQLLTNQSGPQVSRFQVVCHDPTHSRRQCVPSKCYSCWQPSHVPAAPGRRVSGGALIQLTPTCGIWRAAAMAQAPTAVAAGATPRQRPRLRSCSSTC